MRARPLLCLVSLISLLVITLASPASAALRLRGVNYDPPGDDSETLAMNKEWFVVVNTGARSRSLEGWSVRDSTADWRYAFPTGFTLAAGESVKVHTGKGADTAHHLYWGHERDVSQFVWNNDGDAARLLDRRGRRVDRCGWGATHPGGYKRC